MTDVEPGDPDFAASGRAGRRNALPDILGSPAGGETADLPQKLAELSLSQAGDNLSSLEASKIKGKNSFEYEGAEGGGASSGNAPAETPGEKSET